MPSAIRKLVSACAASSSSRCAAAEGSSYAAPLRYRDPSTVNKATSLNRTPPGKSPTSRVHQA